MGVIHLLTPEYPPRPGGVAAYTKQLARGLTEAGEELHVWCPDGESGEGFTVHPVLGRFAAADLDRAGRLLDEFPHPRRLIVQWVPHGYGRRAMNVPFCVWLWRRAALGDRVELMVHEPYLSFWDGGWRQAGAAAVHRVMTTILLRAAAHVWISVPAWEQMWRPYALRRSISFSWLPIPSPLRQPDDRVVRAVRAALAPDGAPIVGHLGTFGGPITLLLERVLPELLRRSPSTRVLLIGTGSDRFGATFAQRYPAWAGRVAATGLLDDSSLAAYVSACDLLLQPYPDGISSRRTTAMAGLRLGVPIVTTRGYVTEPLWEESLAVRLTSVERVIEMVTPVLDLLADPAERSRLGQAGLNLYDCTFELGRTLTALTGSTQGRAA